MAEVVVAEFMDEAAVAELRGAFEVVYDPTLVDRPDDLIAAVAAARGLIVRNRTQVRGRLLAAATRLEAIGRLGVGLDNIDLDACRARGIAVLPATGANAVAVAEYVIAAALTLLRPAFAALPEMLSGAWPRERLIGRELSGRRLGLVGYGLIAREVAARARAMGMTIAAHDPHLAAADPAWIGVERHDQLHALLAAADLVSLHVPLDPTTRNLIDATALAAMRPGAHPHQHVPRRHPRRGGAGAGPAHPPARRRRPRRLRPRAPHRRGGGRVRRLPQPDPDAAHRRGDRGEQRAGVDVDG